MLKDTCDITRTLNHTQLIRIPLSHDSLQYIVSQIWWTDKISEKVRLKIWRKYMQFFRWFQQSLKTLSFKSFVLQKQVVQIICEAWRVILPLCSEASAPLLPEIVDGWIAPSWDSHCLLRNNNIRPGISFVSMLKGQGQFHIAKGTSLKHFQANRKLLKGTKAKTRGNRGHGLHCVQVIPGL